MGTHTFLKSYAIKGAGLAWIERPTGPRPYFFSGVILWRNDSRSFMCLSRSALRSLW